MISTKEKFIFIHIPKTGGNSLQNILSKYADDEIVCLNSYQDGKERFEVRNKEYPTLKKHSRLLDYKRELGISKLNNFYKFATIRNPWEMVVSFYFSPHRGNPKWSKSAFLNLIYSIPTFEEYIKLPRFKIFNFFYSKENIKSDIDFIIKFEDLQNDFDKVCEIIGLPKETLPVRNQSKRYHYSTYHDEESIRLVKNRFKKAIEWGDYKFENRT